MKKEKTIYVCNECGATFPTWTGKCPSCGAFGSMVEEKLDKKQKITYPKEDINILPITKAKQESSFTRFKTGFKTLDEALGGGFVLGQVVLVSGEPGIGKSTLLLQISSNLANHKKVLYITAEESAHQVYLRAERINALKDNLYIVANTNLETILEAIDKLNPEFIVLDSVQTVYSSELESGAGSVSQVRYISSKITQIAKEKGITSIIVGQVTKEGSIAGPKVLEHIVDTVAQFEGERGHAYRVLKIIKNRFGASGELTVFNMKETGMEEVLDLSSFFLSERPENKAGSIIFPYTEGSKPILVEVQALVSKTVYAVPQRKTQGIDINMLAIITAILEKEANLFLKDRDIFVNVVGGIQIDEPAVMLPVALAIVSSFKNIPIKSYITAFGEVGLTGEVRSVHYSEIRIKESKKFGFNKIISSNKIKDENVIGISHINEAIKIITE
ncbi:DNA repair protein RadA [Venenivibrio stagnispumantis]|uniref:DNA repair protein RadA n=1 Tax=Venenivibrio stagnispumantis TaxID=407998 RepID=A0AA45WPU8_9AQUI|nr:DNA repair protein RadA [Venenivibrio stagnispumantis]MCW4573073.1 DNA repair protein RadA [Venenivibrio stagnispumantis]SMP23050.1 DNA repair protein RadA/Sms [Venenivibrio stagnispumantis]